MPDPGELDEKDRALLEKVETRCETTGAVGAWAASELPAGQALQEPAPLFRKLGDGVVEQEYAQLEA